MTKAVQHKRGTAVDLTAHNPLLSAGEFGIEMDTLKLKVGNGSAAWNDLAYVPTGVRADTAAKFTTDNPTLANKELAVETDRPRFKIGNGTTAWNDLPYVSVVRSDIVGIAGASAIVNMVSLTSAQYTALASKDAATLYIIVD